MRTGWLEWVELVARVFVLITALILASVAFSQMMQIITSFWLQIFYCVFIIALFTVWGFDICRLPLSKKITKRLKSK